MRDVVEMLRAKELQNVHTHDKEEESVERVIITHEERGIEGNFVCFISFKVCFVHSNTTWIPNFFHINTKEHGKLMCPNVGRSEERLA